MSPRQSKNESKTLTSLLRSLTIPKLLSTKDEEKLRNTAREILQKLPPEIKKQISQNPETAMAIAMITLGGGGYADVVLWLARWVAERVTEDGSREIVVLDGEGREKEASEVDCGRGNALKLKAKL
jgi:hypothetical protein